MPTSPRDTTADAVALETARHPTAQPTRPYERNRWLPVSPMAELRHANKHDSGLDLVGRAPGNRLSDELSDNPDARPVTCSTSRAPRSPEPRQCAQVSQVLLLVHTEEVVSPEP
jgi:hypothetical protein